MSHQRHARPLLRANGALVIPRKVQTIAAAGGVTRWAITLARGSLCQRLELRPPMECAPIGDWPAAPASLAARCCRRAPDTFRQPGSAGAAARCRRAQKQPIGARRLLSTIGATSRHPGRHHRGRPQARASHLHDADARCRVRRHRHRVRENARSRTPAAQPCPRGQSPGLRPCPTVSFLRGSSQTKYT